MLFDGDERTVYQEHKVSINDNKWTGTLIVTNKRIVLERLQVTKSRIPIIGKDQKDEIIAFNAPLTEIMKVEVVKKLIGKPVQFKIGHSGKETVFTVGDPTVWQTQILKAKSEMGSHPQQPSYAPPPGYAPGYPPGYGVNINLAVPSQGTQPAPSTQTIERQVVKVRCGYCGGLYDEVDSKCPSCGARR